ncbi:NAD(P)/FAD-dependent oxidoreductase [Streptomyces sp. NPDC014872]|uniref:NAD(P)/FAD-dependent oxidoreductase n=1 Tax=Streptomyces sp. NPDC014872 TaxID=3364926 RepID=UPI0036FFE3F9
MADGIRPASVVVIGAGQGGHQTAASLRERGYEGRITLIGEEDALPYERPPLSKAYLKGEADETHLWLRPEAYYARQAIDRVTGAVVAIDRAARSVRLADGSSYGYGHLVLATGARPGMPQLPGAGLRGVHTLRTVRDAAALRDALAAATAGAPGGAARAVVVGAGFIGLEFAAVARESGCEVTVVEALDRPMARVVSARTAAHFTGLHRRRGNRLVYGQGVTAFHDDGHGRVAAVGTADGRQLPADPVLVGIGVVPRTELAETAGLAVSGGIVVDAGLLTGDPHISAIGDCAVFPLSGPGTQPRSRPRSQPQSRLGSGSQPGAESQPQPQPQSESESESESEAGAGARSRTQPRMRLESVQNAVGHAKLVAERLTGAPRPYDELPWFWSDQFGTTVQIAGIGDGHDAEVVLADSPDADAFSVLLFRQEALIAVESVNRPGDHMAARRLLGDGMSLSRAEAARTGFSLTEHLRRSANGGVSAPAGAMATG